LLIVITNANYKGNWVHQNSKDRSTIEDDNRESLILPAYLPPLGVVADTGGYCRCRGLLQIPGDIVDAGGYCRYRLLLALAVVADTWGYCSRQGLLQIQGVIANTMGC